jgi:hypothetical protein
MKLSAALSRLAPLAALCLCAGWLHAAAAEPLSPLIVDPLASAEAVRAWYHGSSASEDPASEQTALVILKRLAAEAEGGVSASAEIGLRRSKSREALAREALETLSSEGIDAAAIARRVVARLQSARAGGEQDRLVAMSEFLAVLPPEEEALERIRGIETASLEPARQRVRIAAILRVMNSVPAEKLAPLLERLKPLLISAYGDEAPAVLAGWLIETDAPASLWTPLIAALAKGVSTADPLTDALATADSASRDRLLASCADSAITALRLADASHCASAIAQPDMRVAMSRRLASGYLQAGQLARAEHVLGKAAVFAEDPGEKRSLQGQIAGIAAFRALLRGENTKPIGPFPMIDPARLPEETRLALFSAMLRQGHDLEMAIAATPDAALRIAVERDAALAEIANGRPVDAELRWRAMPLGREWFRLGSALYIAAKLSRDAELAGEIRSQLLIAASDGLSRFDADIAGLMLALTGQPPEAEALSPAARMLAARMAALDNWAFSFASAERDAPLQRALAMQNAMSLDRFGLIGGRKQSIVESSGPSQPADDAREANGVRITASTAPVMAAFAIPGLERKNLTAANALAELPMTGGVKAAIITLNTHSGRYFEDIVGTLSTRDHIHAAQRTAAPRFIRIMDGVTRLGGLRRILGPEATDLISVDEGRIILHVPIVIGPKAALVLDGAEASLYELDSAAGAFIVNAGRLDIAATTLAASSFNGEFRSFITAWSSSRTVIARAELSGLGYGGGSAHGLTIRSGPESMLSASAAMAPPSALIVDSLIEGFYAAFLARGARDVTLVGNVVLGAAHGGISPREATVGFFSAFNTIRNVAGGPALFVTNEVSGAVLIGNQAIGNERAGIVLDRRSDNALGYANRSAENGGDGIALFESSCVALVMNAVEQNSRSGLKLRNSRDVGIFANTISGNRGAAIRAYVAAVPKLGQPALIPALATLDAGWNQLGENGRGLSLEGVSGARLFANRFLRQSPRLFAGDIKGHAGRLLRDQESGSAIITGVLCRPKRPTTSCLPASWLKELTAGLPDAYDNSGDEAFCTGSVGSIQHQAIERSGGRKAGALP